MSSVKDKLWVSGSEDAFDGCGCLADLGVEGSVAFVGGVVDTVAEVFVYEPDAHALKGFGDRADLGQDVEAVRIFPNHPLESSDLAFDAAESIEVVIFGECVSGHDGGVLLVAARALRVEIGCVAYPHEHSFRFSADRG